MTEAANLPKGRLVLALIAIFLSSMCTMGDLVISPIAADVYVAFSGSPDWIVNLGITGPTLFGLPFGLLTGLLCDRLDKKIIMIAGFGIFTFASVFGLAIENVYYFVTMRLFATGVGWGITNTAALSILADLFIDQNEHGKYVGWYNSVMSVLGAILASISGVLAVGAWQNAFRTYLLAIPVLVMLIAFLPKLPPVKKAAPNVAKVKGASMSSAAATARALFIGERETAPKGWWKKLAPLTMLVYLVSMLYFVILYMGALYVADAGVGDESFVGLLASILTISSALSSLFFGRFYKRLENKIYIPALFTIGFVFFVLALFPTVPIIIAALAIAGLSWPFFFCYYYTRCTQLVPVSRQSTATSIVASASGLAATSCSFLLKGITEITGGTCLTVYPLFGAAMLVLACVSLITTVRPRRETRIAD